METMNSSQNGGQSQGNGAGKFVLGAAIGAAVGAIAGKIAHDKYVENKDEIDAKLRSAKEKAVETKNKAVTNVTEFGKEAKGKAQRGALKATRGAKKGLDKIEKKLED